MIKLLSPKSHIAILIMLFLASNLYGDPAKVCPELLTLLQSGESANIVVFFVQGVQPALQRAAALQFDGRPQRNEAIVHELKDNADSSQSGVLGMLSTRSAGGFTSFKSFWLGNKVIIKDANLETTLEIAEDPEVLKIKKEVLIRPPNMEELLSLEKISKRDVPEEEDWDGLWGVKLLQVEEAWEEGGTRGEGLVVGHIDTGVYAEHEALSENFVGVEYGWFDGEENLPEPQDSLLHGTHTLGTFVGGKGIGVAPGAKWMSCRGCGIESCQGLHECIQWMACPTLPDGTNPDCSKTPLVINNSWGGPHSEEVDEEFREEMMAWRELGIIPIFAIGNGFNFCNNTGSPGQLPLVIGVGASTKQEYLSILSSLGYASDGGIKPDLVAPGERVVSSVPPGVLAFLNLTDDQDKIYGEFHGTSMSSPHVAGIVALMKARDPELTYDQAYELLTQNTDPVTTNPDPMYENYICKDYDQEVFPNNYVGYGRVNALKALQAQTQLLSKKKRK